jgi:hypothetical protein
MQEDQEFEASCGEQQYPASERKERKRERRREREKKEREREREKGRKGGRKAQGNLEGLPKPLAWAKGPSVFLWDALCRLCCRY